MNMKRLIAGCMSLLVFAGSIAGLSERIQADAASQPAYRNNQVTEQLKPADMQTDIYYTEDLQSSSQRFAIKSTQTVSNYNLADSEWADDGSDYYFSLMSTAEKTLYLNLKVQADHYLTGTDNFQTTTVLRNGQSVKVYILPMVSYDGLTTAQMKKVFQCFLFENPQYYFMRNAVVCSESSKMMSVGLYEIFANGSKRAAYTQQFQQQLELWEQQIDPEGTTVEKEQMIHWLICQNVDYNNDMTADDPDDKEMSQSCISAVLFERSTVCAGYAQLFTLLCNRAGIQCVTVTSASHAWNKVRMGSIWYNVDCTWNDSRGDEAYLNVTDVQLKAEDTRNAEHTLSSEWQGIAPSCTVSFDPVMANSADTGANILAPDKMMGITVLSLEKKKVSVSFQPVEGCDGYTVKYASDAAMNIYKKKDIEKTACTITDLKSGKIYYVRVRGYVLDSNGTKLYGTYSQKLKVTVK